MITFSYDETSGFELVTKDTSHPTMLAGVVYHNNNEIVYKGSKNKKIEPERARIVTYLQSVCERRNASFPRDLHVKKDKSNKTNVARVKEEIKKSLPEFIKKGCFAIQRVLRKGSNMRRV